MAAPIFFVEWVTQPGQGQNHHWDGGPQIFAWGRPSPRRCLEKFFEDQQVWPGKFSIFSSVCLVSNFGDMFSQGSKPGDSKARMGLRKKRAIGCCSLSCVGFSSKYPRISINLVRGNFDGTKPMMSFPKAATQWKFDCSWIQDSSEPMPLMPWGCYENAKQAWPLENGFRSKTRVEPTRTWRYKNQTCRLGTIIAELMEGCWRLGNFSNLFTMANNIYIYICIFRRKLRKKIWDFNQAQDAVEEQAPRWNYDWLEPHHCCSKNLHLEVSYPNSSILLGFSIKPSISCWSSTLICAASMRLILPVAAVNQWPWWFGWFGSAGLLTQESDPGFTSVLSGLSH